MLRKQEIIFVVGGPGSGKGTHCKQIQDKYHYHHISTGDLVRGILASAEHAADESDQIKHIRDTIKKGGLLSDAFIIDILKEEIKKHPHVEGFLIDGCPRTLGQAELFEKEIAACDTMLFLNTSDEVMTQRMLRRAESEKRSDDNPETIKKRLDTYHQQTAPVIAHFKTHRVDIVREIDTSGSVDDVAKSIESLFNLLKPAPTPLLSSAPTLSFAVGVSPPVKSVGYFTLAKLYLTSDSFCDAVDQLQLKYQTTEFEVKSYLPLMPSIYIFQDAEHVKAILRANTTTGFQNRNFDIASRHYLNINALQAFSGAQDMSHNPLWENIHKGLSQSTGDSKLINRLIDKHIRLLFAQKSFVLDIEFEKFMLAFWCEYMFGPKVNVDAFSKTRDKLITTMRYTFYNNSRKNTPVLGDLTSRFYGWMKTVEFGQIDEDLDEYINESVASKTGLMARFKDKLDSAADFPKDKVKQALIDNAFDLILVFDFIHNALYETLAKIVKEKLDADDKRREAYAPGLREAFLFPFRARIAQQTFTIGKTTIAQGSHIYVNLLKSGLYHSYGPRACIGAGVTGWVKDRLFNHLKDIQLNIIKVTLPKRRQTLHNCSDVPVSPESYEVTWEYPRNYLERVLPHYKFKSVEKFRDVLKMYENPRLFQYGIVSFKEMIEALNLDQNELVIVAPEVRGIPLAAAVAFAFDVPQVYIRKPDKIPGEIISRTYENAYSVEVLELSKTSNVKGKQVVIIDDGIATGGTTKICCELVEELGGNVNLILAIINHTYKQKIPALASYQDRIRTLFDFDNDTIKPSSAVKVEAIEDKHQESPLLTAKL